MSTQSCDQVRELAAELALDALPGDERAAALAHLDDCPACRDLVDDLSRAADDVLTVLPPGEVPPELEERIRSAAPSAARPALRGGRARRVLGAAAVVIVIAAGGVVLGVRSADAPDPADGTGEFALVTASGEPVGRVEITSDEPPEITMELDEGDGEAVFRCIVTADDGSRSDIGYLQITDGTGEWTGPLDHDPAAITAAELVDDAGRVVATATIE